MTTESVVPASGSPPWKAPEDSSLRLHRAVGRINVTLVRKPAAHKTHQNAFFTVHFVVCQLYRPLTDLVSYWIPAYLHSPKGQGDK